MKKTCYQMKRLICTILVLALFVSTTAGIASAAAPHFSYTDAQDARLRALECMMICGFSTEWDGNGNANASSVLRRWEKTIWIYVSGSPGSDDLRQLDAFIMEVATHCPNMPNIRLADRESDANIVIYYGPLNTLSDHVDYYQEGNWGAFSYYYGADNGFVSGKVGIATDVNTAESKRHLLREELVGLFGLCNDHYAYSDSILYQEWTTVEQLSEVDWLMLNMLYDPDLSCGMSAGEAYRILLQKIQA